MSGASERVEVDVSPSEFVDEGAGDPSAGEAVPGTTSSSARSRSSIFEMLQSTEPRESPDQQDGTLSTSAAWYQHAELALKKMTGSTGTPAWANWLMAGLTLGAESAGLKPGSGNGAESSTSTETEGAQRGEVQGVADNGETSVIG